MRTMLLFDILYVKFLLDGSINSIFLWLSVVFRSNQSRIMETLTTKTLFERQRLAWAFGEK